MPPLWGLASWLPADPSPSLPLRSNSRPARPPAVYGSLVHPLRFASHPRSHRAAPQLSMDDVCGSACLLVALPLSPISRAVLANRGSDLWSLWPRLLPRSLPVWRRSLVRQLLTMAL